MTALKTAERSQTVATQSRTRKPWRKKTPVEVVFEQTDVLRSQIVTKEKELAEMKTQLKKFEEAKRIFET